MICLCKKSKKKRIGEVNNANHQNPEIKPTHQKKDHKRRNNTNKIFFRKRFKEEKFYKKACTTGGLKKTADTLETPSNLNHTGSHQHIEHLQSPMTLTNSDFHRISKTSRTQKKEELTRASSIQCQESSRISTFDSVSPGAYSFLHDLIQPLDNSFISANKVLRTDQMENLSYIPEINFNDEENFSSDSFEY